ncbi:hypothetical protein EsDP_00004056 [Epichloe bromicola]|uniref:Uncharacterized protein n=1 Tax=Epichloe bromicola TaxID=79588 RepID=A0ABQ0CQK6_9HYPO
MEKATHYFGIKKFINPTSEDIRKGFKQLERPNEEDIKGYYDSYLSGSLVSHVIHKLPALDVVHSSDIHVYYSSVGICKCHTDIIIERRSRERTRNYMGYHRDERCYVFAGQRRLIEQFLELMADLLNKGQIETAFFQPRALQIPLEGFNPGLDYEQFADYIENWDCILFLLPTLDDPLNIDYAASLKKVSPAEMYGPESFGLLVEESPAGQEQNPQGIKSEIAPIKVFTEAGVGKDKVNAGQVNWGRYSLRKRNSSIKYN